MAIRKKRKPSRAGSKNVKVTVEVKVSNQTQPPKAGDPINEADLVLDRLKRRIPQSQNGGRR